MPYLEHLSRDKRLKKAMDQVGPLELKGRKDLWLSLCGSIMSQQLSTKVAAVIYGRFMDLYGGKPEPQLVLDTPTETLRAIGLSNAKVAYIHNVSRFALERGLGQKQLAKLSNEEVIEYLTEIKGVGRWTVEMLLMFSMKREDVFAVDDLGIQQGMIKLYKLEKEPKKQLKEDMLKISRKWAPYRTYACLYLWRWKDGD
jgi:DNA-3-methyladenine glycosylase II